MTEEKNKIDRSQAHDEALLIRPSGVSALNSMDQISYNYYNNGAGNDGFNIREIWRKIRKRKWLVLTIGLIATTIVSIESFRTKSMYQAAAKVAINQEGTMIVAGDMKFGVDVSNRIKTELLLLQTYPLLEDVVVRLKLDQNPDFLDVGNRRSVVEAVRTIVSKFDKAPSKITESKNVTTELLNIGPGLDGSRSAAESKRLAPYVEVLQSYLFVDQIPETRAIDIRFSHTDPEIASAVANGVAKVFVDYSFKNKSDKFNSSADWLDRETRNLFAKTQQAEQELANYSSNNNIFTGDQKDNLTIEKLAELYGKALKAEQDRIIKESVFTEVQQGRVAQLPEAFTDVRTAEIQNTLSKLQLEAARLKARFGPENPKVTENNEQIIELQKLLSGGTKSLEEKLKADYERAAREEKLIKESLAKARDEAVDQNQAAIKFNLLKQDVDTTKALYNDFLSKTYTAGIQRKDQYNDLKLIEPARTPAAPVGPRRLRSIILGLLLSLVAGAGLALGIEYLDNTVKSIEDVARATQLPTLALIPAMNVQSMRILNAKKKAQMNGHVNGKAQKQEPGGKVTKISGVVPRSLQPRGNKLSTLDGLSSVVEAYRMLRTSVLLSTAGTPPKTILVTSSQPGEGKTTTAVNTAISLAQLGASVLLIDSDLRRPAVHKTFKLQNTKGLSSYLSGSAKVEDLMTKLPITNLSVLTSGPIPPNPAELISSERMKEMLRSLCETYDHIIIDSPPLISVTDPVILSTMVDGAILVVQAGRSTRDMVRRARQELGGVGAKIFGVVLNNVDVKREGYDEYYHQRYYSSYGEQQQKGASVG